ncbi:LysR family transcriptional regulator [Cryptosporangium phraense]|uniref:LysR family transcriptional regulator n=1 Tax=Cryptosporangium phraense TaxID=2593070 RepID=A0A545AX30_9ACTN|nr:LysR substrate-binding domain-containing protein [Cryptosporangium phraense]TQS45880.1 LysR family transcriptional regulator [Cryptosporangium phraense]
MADLDLRRLRYFLSLADELNYGRAAESLHLAQPALSRSIAALERELGVKLFERSRAGTRLAPAGELLREEARELLRAADALQRRVRVAEREGRSITLGFAPGVILTPIIRHLEQAFPGLLVNVLRTTWGDQITALRDGRVDATFATRPFDDEGLDVVELYSEARVVVLPDSHPGAGERELTLADLADDLLLQPAAAVPEWTGAVGYPGFDDAKGQPATPTVEEKFEHVAAGRGVLLLTGSAARFYRRPGVTSARVADLPETRICLVVEPQRRSAVLRELERVAPSLSCADADAASVGT